jgi:hypothetical protein
MAARRPADRHRWLVTLILTAVAACHVGGNQRRRLMAGVRPGEARMARSRLAPVLVGMLMSTVTSGSRIAYRRRRRAVGVVASSLSILVAACVAAPPITRDPTAAGVVQQRESIGDTTRFVLRDGRRIDLDLRRARALYGGGVSAAVGDLILVGQDAEPPWFVGISPDSGGEYTLSSREVTLDAAHVQLDSGLRLELGPLFRGRSGRIEGDAPHRIVIDASGEVTSMT